jgi:hypothetical protein
MISILFQFHEMPARRKFPVFIQTIAGKGQGMELDASSQAPFSASNHP